MFRYRLGGAGGEGGVGGGEQASLAYRIVVVRRLGRLRGGSGNDELKVKLVAGTVRSVDKPKLAVRSAG